MAELGFPLYHGTCTLFLERIAQHGLGGWDPIKQWRVVECLRKVLPIAQKYAERSEIIRSQIGNARLMAEQVSAGLNFQHGAVYLSPSKDTAVRYACGKKKGSELISRAVLLIEELVRLNIEEVKTDLYQEFPEVFHLQDIDAAPVLICIAHLNQDILLSERGELPADNLMRIRDNQLRMPDRWQHMSQQLNFRLTQAVPADEIAVSLIAVRKWNQHEIDHGLIPINLPRL